MKIDIAPRFNMHAFSDPTELSQGLLASIVKPVLQWISLQNLKAQIKNERTALRRLNDSQLRDIGLNRSEAMLESNRGFSDIPFKRVKPSAD